MQQSLLNENTSQNTEAFLSHLRHTLKSYFGPVHHSWIENLQVHSHNEEVITLALSQENFINTIEKNNDKFQNIFHREYEMFFNSRKQLLIVLNSANITASIPTEIQHIAQVNNLKKATFLEPKFTFSTFITTSENIFTRMNIESYANKVNEGQTGNLLCITGTIGNGKTHILQAIGHNCEKSTQVQYMTSERFMFLYTKAISQKNITQFRELITETKLLLIDDIHFILTKDGTIKELASIIRYILSCGGNVAITSAIPLHAMNGINKDIQDTFSKANTINIDSPSMQLRYQILEYKNTAFNYNVSQDVLLMLADRISSNIRDLENTFDKIILHGKILNNIIDVNAAKIILKEIFPTTAIKTVSIKTILETVCDFFGVKKEELLAQSRIKELVYARQIGMYLTLELTNETTKKIGFEFGGRSHSTVIHSYKSAKDMIQNDPKAKKDIELLKIQVYGS